ncbi:unnamed protein product, partial [Ectocarpus fasciculatus]
RKCERNACRPLGPAPSPEPPCHGHMTDLDTGQSSKAFWGAPDGAEAAQAGLDLTAPTSRRKKKRKVGPPRDHPAAAVGAAPAMERVSEASSAAGGSSTASATTAGGAPNAIAGPSQRAKGGGEGETQSSPRVQPQDSSGKGGVPVVAPFSSASTAPAAGAAGAASGGASAAGGAACGAPRVGLDKFYQTEVWLGNHDCHCSICGNTGRPADEMSVTVARVYGRPEDLLHCNGCPRAFHRACLPAGTASQLAATYRALTDAWFCPTCTSLGQKSLVYKQQTPDWEVAARVRARGDGAPLHLEDVVSTAHPLFGLIKTCERNRDNEVLSQFRELEKKSPELLQMRLNNEAKVAGRGAAGRAAASRAQAEMMRRPCESATTSSDAPVTAAATRYHGNWYQVVPVCELLLAACESTGLGGETAGHGKHTFDQLVDRMLPSRLHTGVSAVEGCGVFATVQIEPMDVLAEHTGQRITRAVAEQRVAIYRKMNFHVSAREGRMCIARGCVVQLAGDSMYVDSVAVGSMSVGYNSPRLFNHACKPNAYLHTVS